MSIYGNPVMMGGSGGSGIIVPKTITANGVYNASADNADGYSPVTVNVSGGGIESWDFTSATPLVGSMRGVPLTNYNATFDVNGAVFDAANEYLLLGTIPSGRFELEVDVYSMALPTVSAHQRFLMASEDSGLIYRSTHKWEFYSNSVRAWATASGESDPSFFNGSTVKAIIDENGYWHIYKNGVLWYEPDVPYTGTTSIRLGSYATSMLNAVISGFRWA